MISLILVHEATTGANGGQGMPLTLAAFQAYKAASDAALASFSAILAEEAEAIALT